MTRAPKFVATLSLLAGLCAWSAGLHPPGGLPGFNSALADSGGGPAANKHGVAVIIGNKDYQGDIPDVDFAGNDADAFKIFVVDRLGYDPENIIDLRDATQAQLQGAFGNDRSHEGKLWRYLDATGRSDVVVFYSGHGVPGLKDKRGYLLPVNADPDAPEINGYPVDTLLGNLAKLKTKSVSVFLDACFSGDSQKGKLVRATSGILIEPKMPGKTAGMTVITASQGDQVSSWDFEAKHGLFTKHLLDALYGEADKADYGNGDRQISLGEVRSYLDDRMTRAARRTYGRHQKAWIKGSDASVLAPEAPKTRVASVVGAAKPSPAAKPAVGVFPGGPEPGAVFRDCPDCPEMVVLPRGEFMMGVTPEELEWYTNEPGGMNEISDWETPRHRVRIENPFAVAKYEVTRSQYGRFMTMTGRSTGGGCQFYDGGWRREASRTWRSPGFEQSDDHPVTCVSWDDAKAYVNWLSERTGFNYRLLSEAEWEYAARAGTATMRYWGHDWANKMACKFANVVNRDSGEDNSFDCADGYSLTAPVGSFRANAFGLHDVLGNLRELTEDCWNSNYKGALADGRAWRAGDCAGHVVRGGAWKDNVGSVTAWGRRYEYADNQQISTGFRIARTLPKLSSAALTTPPKPGPSPALRPAAGVYLRAPKPGTAFNDCADCPELVVVPAGSFRMGGPRGDDGSGEKPVHKVAIARPLAVGKYEVTFDEWDRCVDEEGCLGYEPDDEGWGRGRRPVINVSWDDAQSYLTWLSAMTGKRYRLLSEAEWEYAARAGTTTNYHVGDTIYQGQGNFDNNAGTVPVGQYPANAFGLHNIHGNVWEWTADCWHESYAGAPADGSAWLTGDCAKRVYRGGAWNAYPWVMRSAYRRELKIGHRGSNVGFRIARELD